MKTFEDIKTITFNDLAFFKRMSVSDAKDDFRLVMGLNTLDSVGSSERLDKDQFGWSMVSNSDLDGKNQMEYMCGYYNRGCSLQELREYSQKANYAKAMKFTGKNQILNDILNPDQLQKLRITWAYTNFYNKPSDAAIVFVRDNQWIRNHLYNKGIAWDKVEKQIEDYEERKNPKKAIKNLQ